MSLHLGYSIVQGGPLPCFMHESLLNKLFGPSATESLGGAEQQLRNGFMKFGLFEVKNQLTCSFILLNKNKITVLQTLHTYSEW